MKEKRVNFTIAFIVLHPNLSLFFFLFCCVVCVRSKLHLQILNSREKWRNEKKNVSKKTNFRILVKCKSHINRKVGSLLLFVGCKFPCFTVRQNANETFYNAMRKAIDHFLLHLESRPKLCILQLCVGIWILHTDGTMA